jgi:hypothetical protein
MAYLSVVDPYLHWRSDLPSARLCCRNRNALTACCTGNHRELSGTIGTLQLARPDELHNLRPQG